MIVNNGFFDPQQDTPAIQVIENWSMCCGLTFGQGAAVGGGGMITALNSVPEGYGPKKNISEAMKTLSSSIKEGRSDAILYVLPNYPEFLYKFQAELGWRIMAKKNGLNTKDLFQK